jgi:NAD+ diphosphatase
MLGFRAEARTAELSVDGEEIADARWFTAAELATFGEWGDESAALRLPRHDSIARLLVDGWVAEVTARATADAATASPPPSSPSTRRA